jgi:hypothetical protein
LVYGNILLPATEPAAPLKRPTTEDRRRPREKAVGGTGINPPNTGAGDMKAILLICAVAIVAMANLTSAQADNGKIGTIGGTNYYGPRDLYRGLTPLERMTTVNNGPGQVPPPKHR